MKDLSNGYLQIGWGERDVAVSEKAMREVGAMWVQAPSVGEGRPPHHCPPGGDGGDGGGDGGAGPSLSGVLTLPCSSAAGTETTGAN